MHRVLLIATKHSSVPLAGFYLPQSEREIEKEREKEVEKINCLYFLKLKGLKVWYSQNYTIFVNTFQNKMSLLRYNFIISTHME